MERLLRKRERQRLTYRELSEESGIPIPTLSWWSRKLVQEREGAARPRACELMAVEVVDDIQEEGGTAIEIVVAGRLSLLVPPTVSEAHLQRVLRAIVSC